MRARPYLEQALALAETFDLPEIFVDALTSKSLALTIAGRFEEAEILLEGALARAEARDLPRATAAPSTISASSTSRSTGIPRHWRARNAPSCMPAGPAITRRDLLLRSGNVSSLVLIGRWDEAIQTADELAASPQSRMVANMTVHALEIDCWRGDLERARKRLDAATGGEPTDDPQSLAGLALHEAVVARAEGKPKVALEKLQPALDSRDHLGIRFLIVKLAIIEELECASALGDTPRIERVLASIDDLRPGEPPPLLTAHASRFRARLTADAGEVEREFRRAANVFREHDLVFWLAVTQLEFGEYLIGQDHGHEAEPLLADAHETFERLGATPWIHRVAEVAPARRPRRGSGLALHLELLADLGILADQVADLLRDGAGEWNRARSAPGLVQIQASPSGSSGSCARNSSSVVFESARLQRSRRTVTRRSSSRPRAASRARP